MLEIQNLSNKLSNFDNYQNHLSTAITLFLIIFFALVLYLAPKKKQRLIGLEKIVMSMLILSIGLFFVKSYITTIKQETELKLIDKNLSYFATVNDYINYHDLDEKQRVVIIETTKKLAEKTNNNKIQEYINNITKQDQTKDIVLKIKQIEQNKESE